MRSGVSSAAVSTEKVWVPGCAEAEPLAADGVVRQIKYRFDTNRCDPLGMRVARLSGERTGLLTDAERRRIPRQRAGWGYEEVSFGFPDAVILQSDADQGTTLLCNERWKHEPSIRVDMRCWFPSRELHLSAQMAAALSAALSETLAWTIAHRGAPWRLSASKA